MRINITGCAPGWENVPDGIVWGINDVHLLRNVDVIFDCHNIQNVLDGKERLGRRTVKEVKNHLRLLKEKEIPFFTTELIKGMPNSIKYPIKEIINEFDSDYFAGGVDYAIALAIYQGATEIHLYGVLMIRKGEYAFQKPSVEHWLGVAKGVGVKVKVHGMFSTILKTKNYLLYGYNSPQSFVKEVNPDYHDLNEMS